MILNFGLSTVRKLENRELAPFDESLINRLLQKKSITHREFKMLRIIAGISRRTISLSRPVLVAERNQMKNPDMLPSGNRGFHNPDGFSFWKSDLIKAIQSHLTDALVEVTDTSDGCGSNFNIQVYLLDIPYRMAPSNEAI